MKFQKNTNLIFFSTGISFFNLIKVLSMPAFGLSATGDMLKWIFLAFPHYALGSSLFSMNQAKITSEVCRIQCERLQHALINLELSFNLAIPIPQYIKNYAIWIPIVLNNYADKIHLDTIIQEIRNYAKLLHIDPIFNGTDLSLRVKWNESIPLSFKLNGMCGEFLSLVEAFPCLNYNIIF